MDKVYDLIIVGGGINGTALARVAAYQGLSVALFEQGDWGEGTSSASSKLIHGGVRYLEHMRFGLVREAVRERAGLLKAAPHLVESRRFAFPITRRGRHIRPAIKAGMVLYDILRGKDKTLAGHEWWNGKKLKNRDPGFLPDEDCGAYIYSDCVMDDARLCLENVLDARSLGADAHSYHRFLGVEEDLGAKDRDQSDLEVTVLDRRRQKEIVFRSRRLAFALGPWTNKYVKAEFSDAKDQVRLSQGAHLVLEGLSLQGSYILPVAGTKRYFFVFPWKDVHIVGTTELDYGSTLPDRILAQDGEVEELKRLFGEFFPQEPLKVRCTFAGIRPLAYSKKGSTASLSREHEFHKLHRGVFSVVGGKYTTYRAMVEQFLAFILGKGATVRSISERPYPGAANHDSGRGAILTELLKKPFCNPDMAATWYSRYGSRALELAARIEAQPGWEDVLCARHRLLKGEVMWSIETENTVTAVDFFRRRTSLFFDEDGGLDCHRAVEGLLRAHVAGYTHLGNLDLYPGYLEENRHVAAQDSP